MIKVLPCVLLLSLNFGILPTSFSVLSCTGFQQPISFLLIVTNPGTPASCLKKSTVDEEEIEGATANLAAAQEIHLRYVAVETVLSELDGVFT